MNTSQNFHFSPLPTESSGFPETGTSLRLTTFLQHKARMAEESKRDEKLVPDMCMASMKSASHVSCSNPSTPTLKRSGSSKQNCLCSPTTHAGSFRCRYHRNSGLMRSSMSVGSKLSDLTGKLN